MKNGGARLLVIGAAILVGILVLAKGFQGFAASGPGPQQSPSSSTSPSPSPGGTQSPGTPGGGGGPSPHQQGVVLAIYNATTTNGLAAAAQNELKAKGYVVAKLGNLPPANQTVIYYKDEQGKADAQHLNQLAVHEANIQKLPKNLPPEASIPKNAELVVVLGSDYAQSHPVSG